MTPYNVLVPPAFERDYVNLPEEVARRIDEKVDYLAEHPEQMQFPLKHLPESLRAFIYIAT